MMTLEEYTKEVRKQFNVGKKPQMAVDEYFNEQETKDYIKEAYESYSHGDSISSSCTPSAVASCLDMLY